MSEMNLAVRRMTELQMRCHNEVADRAATRTELDNLSAISATASRSSDRK
jgi:hypothetical protein